MRDQDYKKFKIYVAPVSDKNPLGKTGCTKHMSRVRRQEAEVIYDTNDLFMASMFERMGQILHGHPLDNRMYHETYNDNKDRVKTGDTDKMVESRRNNGNMNSNTPEVIAKCKATKERNGTGGDQNTPESIAIGLETRRSNRTLPGDLTTIIKSNETKRRNETFTINKVATRDLRTGEFSQVTKEEFDQHDYYVGTTSKKLNYKEIK